MSINLGSLDVTFRPLTGEWPGHPTPASERKHNPFRSQGSGWGSSGYGKVPWQDTITLLERELSQLSARDVVVRMALTESQIRLDGLPRASAKPEHPGVILSFEIPGIGRVQYGCDQYRDWKANVRAIAKTLQALRSCERWGVLDNQEQFRGSLQLAAGPYEPFQSVGDAILFVVELGDVKVRNGSGVIEYPPQVAEAIGGNDALLRSAIRRAEKTAHPDHGGLASDWHRLAKAKAMIVEHLDRPRLA